MIVIIQTENPLKTLIRIWRALHEYVNFVDLEKHYRSLSACWNHGTSFSDCGLGVTQQLSNGHDRTGRGLDHAAVEDERPQGGQARRRPRHSFLHEQEYLRGRLEK